MKKVVTFCLVALLCFLSACSDRDELSQLVEEKASDLNFTCQVASTSVISYNGSSLDHYDIECDGFDSYSYDEMFRIAKGLHSITTSKKTYYLENILSDGDRYTIYTSTNSIYKNGKEVYSDYWNSDSHKSASASKNATASTSDSGVRHTNAEAFTCAQEIVEKNLKAPSTAKFCKVTEATVTNDGDRYTVKGWVDAENSFGATLRQNFTVTYTALKKGTDIGYKNASVTFS